ncbi:preprotein translocase subunit TatA [Calidifontibacter sp. DB0510]|uniref:Preprotein translocase subunit TatA n=1 Tax=Metallococcus carri TaxID=1656884 RepID=A0A967EFC4_9MICO|nr:preprotein translocase subunit TatA [Metallococcus carri]NHN56506.1 preprotein translocase subunit TatA [Metallococcus carri]NOP36130.1 preprotein translocase subunit TatA [Calidifontibacter sp. DB2511S]
MFGLDGWKLLILLLLATFLIGPERLPEYMAKLREFIKQARSMADGAKTQLRDQMGPEFDDIDWRQYDPRQYDPRRIVRQALFDDDEPGQADAAAPVWEPPRYDPDRVTPYDIDAT